MSQALPYDEIKFDKNVKADDVLNTSDDSDFGYFVEVDLKNRDNIKNKTKISRFAPANKVIPQNRFCYYLNEIKPYNYTQNKKLICDRTYKKM